MDPPQAHQHLVYRLRCHHDLLASSGVFAGMGASFKARSPREFARSMLVPLNFLSALVATKLDLRFLLNHMSLITGQGSVSNQFACYSLNVEPANHSDWLLSTPANAYCLS